MAFTAVTNWVSGLVTSAMMNARINVLITELQTALTPQTPANLTLVTAPAGSVTTIETGTARARADGNFGLAWGRLSRASAVPASPTLIATLPAGIVPLDRAEGLFWGGGATAVNVEVRTDGGIYATAVVGSPTVIRFAVSFPV